MLFRLVPLAALTVCGLALLGGLPMCAAGSTGNVTGYVVDTKGVAIASAGVSSVTKSASTGSTGQYTLSGLPTGTQTMKATAAFFTTSSVTVNILSSKTVKAPNIVLTAYYGSISGVITDASTLKPLAHAVVAIGGTTLKATSDTNGHYAFAKAPVGSDTLTASAAGYQSASTTVSVANGSSVTVNFTVRPAIATGPGSTILWNGSSSYLLGANYAWYNYGTDFGTGDWGKYTDWTAVGNGFAALNSQGARVVRYWVFADGRYSPEFNSDGTVSGLDGSVLSDVDHILQIAANTNTYLVLTVIDGSIWSNASFSGSVQMGGHSALITSAVAQQTFLDNALKPLLQHIAASSYKNRVLGYDIVNEPEANMSGYWGGTNLQASQVQTFVKNCATYIHTYGSGSYATVGSATPYYVSTWKNLGLDFYQLHYYPWMDFNNGAGSGLPTYASLGLDKPCIVGEFPTADADYTLGSTNPLSAQWYLDSAYGKGYAGSLGWSFAVGDSATNWASFQPVFSNWSSTHSSFIGPK